MCGYTFGSQSVAYCFWVTVTLTLSTVLEKSCAEHILCIVLEEGFPNLDFGYILGCQSVPYYFGVTLTLTSGTSPILLEDESQISVWLHLGVAECHTLFL